MKHAESEERCNGVRRLHPYGSEPRMLSGFASVTYKNSLASKAHETCLGVTKMTERLIRRPEVLSMTGMATSTLYDAIARGSFPRPVKIGRRAVAWPESDLARWLDGLKAEREADAT